MLSIDIAKQKSQLRNLGKFRKDRPNHRNVEAFKPKLNACMEVDESTFTSYLRRIARK